MNHKSQPQSISWFQDHYRAGRLVLRPPFQRKPVWTEKQRSALIESILLDIPIPEIYVQVSQSIDGTQQYGVVDGQQRLRTILQFVGVEREEDQVAGDDQNRFSLDKLPTKSKFFGVTFEDIDVESKKKFFQYEMCVRLIFTEEQSNVEDVFKRLNKFLLPLRPQELRNATYHGAFAKLCEALADEEYWAVNRIVSPASIRRMGDIEMMSDLLIGLMHGPQGGSARIIDEYYEEYEQYDDEFPGQIKTRKLFLSSLDLVQSLFPDISSTPRWSNRADFYSLFVAVGEVSPKGKLSVAKRKQLAADLVTFAEQVSLKLEKPNSRVPKPVQDYSRAIEKGSNDKARRVDRHEALVELIATHFG